MITIDLLKNHPHHLPRLSALWYALIGKIWLPNVSLKSALEKFSDHLNEDKLPLTLIAFEGGIPVGMSSLREDDLIRPDLKLWLGSLIVDPLYQKRGIGKILIEETKKKAQSMGYKKLYISVFDPTILNYYERLGWTSIDWGEFNHHKTTIMEIVL